MQAATFAKWVEAPCTERVRELEAEVERLRAENRELREANARLLAELRRLEEQLRRVEDERDRALTRASFLEEPEEEWW